MTEKLDPAHLDVEVLARLLTAAGGRAVGVDMIRQDLEAGAPQNPDGTMNLIHYAAWLAKVMGERR